MNRRDFIINGAVGFSVLSSGCIDFSSNPELEIVEPKPSSETGKQFNVSVRASNYNIRDPSIPVESENAGYIIITVNKALKEGSTVDNDKASINEWLDGQKKDQIDVNVPGKHTIRAYIANSNREVTSSMDSVNITSSFDFPSTITIGENQSLNVNPNYVEVPNGTTLTFNWRVNGVNLLPVESPDETDWQGLENPQPQGHTYEYSFEDSGTYRFKCEPHGNVMQGTIRVI